MNLYNRGQGPVSPQSECVNGAVAAKMSPRILVALLAVGCVVSAQTDVENSAREFLQRFDEEATQRMYQYSLASWAYNTDITKENSDKLVSI